VDIYPEPGAVFGLVLPIIPASIFVRRPFDFTIGLIPRVILLFF